jgi:hypothetical protein
MTGWQEKLPSGLYKKEEKEELKEENIKEVIIVQDQEKLPEPMRVPHICENCKGNGYIRIDTIHGKDQIKQCWVCDSKGEIKKYVQAEVDKFIFDYYYDGDPNRVRNQ